MADLIVAAMCRAIAGAVIVAGLLAVGIGFALGWLLRWAAVS